MNEYTDMPNLDPTPGASDDEAFAVFNAAYKDYAAEHDVDVFTADDPYTVIKPQQLVEWMLATDWIEHNRQELLSRSGVRADSLEQFEIMMTEVWDIVVPLTRLWPRLALSHRPAARNAVLGFKTQVAVLFADNIVVAGLGEMQVEPGKTIAEGHLIGSVAEQVRSVALTLGAKGLDALHDEQVEKLQAQGQQTFPPQGGRGSGPIWTPDG